MAEERAIIIKTTVELGELTRQAAEWQTQIDKMKDKQKELTASGQKNSVEFQNNATQLRQLQTAYRDTVKQIDLQVKANTAAKGSNEQLRASLALQTKAYNALSQEQREGTAVGRAMGRGILDLTSLLKENESAVGDNRRNVGNYANSLKGLERQLDELNERVSTLDIGSEEFKKTQAEITKTRDAIGLASGKFDEFGERIKKGNAEALDTFNDVGQGIVAAFAIAPLFGENQAAAELQANALKAIAIAQNTVAIAKGISNLNELKGIIITKTAAAGTAIYTAAQTAYAASVGTSTGATKLLRIALLSLPFLVIGTAIVLLVQNFDAISAAVKDFIGVSGEAREKTAEDYKRMSEQAQEASAKFKKEIDLRISLIKDETERSIAEIKERSRREQQENKGNAEIIKLIKQKEADDIAAIRAKAAEEEQKQRDEDLAKAKVAAEKKAAINLENAQRKIRITKEGFDEELALFDLQTQEEIKAARKRGADVNLVILERQQERQKMLDEFNAKEKEKADAAAAEEAARKKAEADAEADEQMRELEEIQAAGERELQFETSLAESKKALREQEIQGAADLAGGLISALSTTEAAQKKNAGAIKALAVSQALINGYLAVQKALASAPPPANFIQAGIVGIATGVNVNKILSTPAFARGGAISGKRITNSDGVPIRPLRNGDSLLSLLTPGEVVLNKRQQNDLGGASTFRRIGVPGFADGGFVNDQIQQSINANFDIQGLKQAMREVQISVGVDEIAKKMARVRALETNRTL